MGVITQIGTFVRDPNNNMLMIVRLPNGTHIFERVEKRNSVQSILNAEFPDMLNNLG